MEKARATRKKAESVPNDGRDNEAEEEVEVEAVVNPERPTCPQCGWHNTRLSHTKTPFLDSLLRVFSLRAFRCRTCGNRFRAIRRDPKG